MTVSELIAALQDLINEDDNGSGVAQMQVYCSTECGYVLIELNPPVVAGEKVLV